MQTKSSPSPSPSQPQHHHPQQSLSTSSLSSILVSTGTATTTSTSSSSSSSPSISPVSPTLSASTTNTTTAAAPPPVSNVLSLYVVYNADSTLAADLLYRLKKRLGLGRCAACAITHGVSPSSSRREKPDFAQLKTTTGWTVPLLNIYRDQMDETMSLCVARTLPCVVARTDTGDFLLVHPSELQECAASVDSFTYIVDERARRARLRLHRASQCRRPAPPSHVSSCSTASSSSLSSSFQSFYPFPSTTGAARGQMYHPHPFPHPYHDHRESQPYDHSPFAYHHVQPSPSPSLSLSPSSPPPHSYSTITNTNTNTSSNTTVCPTRLDFVDDEYDYETYLATASPALVKQQQ